MALGSKFDMTVCYPLTCVLGRQDGFVQSNILLELATRKLIIDAFADVMGRPNADVPTEPSRGLLLRGAP